VAGDKHIGSVVCQLLLYDIWVCPENSCNCGLARGIVIPNAAKLGPLARMNTVLSMVPPMINPPIMILSNVCTNPLANPQLQLFSGQTQIAYNNNWQTTDPMCLSPATFCGDDQDIIGTGLDPCSVTPTGCTLDSGIYVTLPPGTYSVFLSGVGGVTGVGIVEVFDVP